MRLSLDKLVNFWSKVSPESIAIQTPKRSVSYSELVSISNNISCQQIEPEQKYGIIIHDTIIYISLLLAMMRERRIFINLCSEIPQSELAEYLRSNKISSIISDDQELLIDHTIKSIDIKELMISTCSDREVEQSLDDIVGGFLSSGTTGIPTIYYRNQYSLISEAILWIMELRLSQNKSFFISKPLSYIGSFVLLYSVLYSGGKVVLPDDYSSLLFPTDVMDFVFLTPFDIRNLLNSDICMQCRNVITMGASISASEKQLLSEHYNCNVFESWGNSEGLATITNLYEDPKCESVGRATFTDEIFILDANGEKLPADRIGIIAGITDNDTTSNAGQSLIISEDVGFLDKNKRLHLIGRKDNVLIFSDNLYFSTTDFESHIRESIAVHEVAVLLINNKVFVFINPKSDSFDLAEVCDLFVSLYGNKSQDGRIIFERTIIVKDFKYNANGKMDYLYLQTMI